MELGITFLVNLGHMTGAVLVSAGVMRVLDRASAWVRADSHLNRLASCCPSTASAWFVLNILDYISSW